MSSIDHISVHAQESDRPVPAAQPATDGSRDCCAPVIRLRPIRTLVIARDLAFRQRATTVLQEFGPTAFAVRSLAAIDEVLALVAKQRADVVVLDATGCRDAIAPMILALYGACRRVGVVVVSGEPVVVPGSPVVLPKWGWAADLSRAVNDAYDHGNPLEQRGADVRV